MLERVELENEQWVTIDVFLNLLKPSNTVIPKQIMNNLKLEYEDREKLIKDRLQKLPFHKL